MMTTQYKTRRVLAVCLIPALFAAGCAKNKPDPAPSQAFESETAMEDSKRTSQQEESIRQAALDAISQGTAGGADAVDGQDEAQAQDLEDPEMQNIDGLSYVDGILIVNKKHGVPADYAPGVDPIAQEHLNELIAQMQADGLDVSWTTSNFRDYDYQSQLYWGYVNANGQEAADTFSARPGFSEHQTGLAFDLKHNSGDLITAPAESQWLLDNCARYGFIVRYQEGKESITGYQAEPWHLRYIGDRAQEIMDSGLTLEEYLGVEGGTEY